MTIETTVQSRKDHLLHPLADGGHGFSEASYGVVWTDSDEFHEYDHNAGNWFSEALLHNHPPADWVDPYTLPYLHEDGDEHRHEGVTDIHPGGDQSHTTHEAVP